MLEATRKLAPGFTILLACGAILIATDSSRRSGSVVGSKPQITLLYHSSIQPVIDAIVGIEEVLRESRGEDSIDLRRLNAEGDIATLRQMAVESASSESTLTLTLTTPALQAFATANQRQAPHLFCLVVDPYAADIGLDASDPHKHPAWLTGIASPPPIERLLRIVKQCNPQVQKVGVAWNPAESNGVASLAIARRAAQKLGLKLMEASAATTGEARTATDSLLGSGIDAFWIPPDINAQNAAPSIITACRSARVPVFVSFTKFVGEGAAVGVGADYSLIGKAAGKMAVRILEGAPIASLAVEQLVPEDVWIDPVVLLRCGGQWSVPADLAAAASVIIGTREPPKKPAVGQQQGSVVPAGKGVPSAQSASQERH